jgi:hypothetical protein
MNIETLKKACEEYKNEEGRASFYDVALEIADSHPLQASIIILAVWNMNRFRFMASDSENLVALQEAIEECKPLVDRPAAVEEELHRRYRAKFGELPKYTKIT